MDLCQCQNIEAMITKCPYCGNEYEIELDHSVGEITIRCPKCKVPFVINNQKEQRLKSIRIVTNAKQEPNTQDDDLSRYLDSKKKRKREPIHISSISRALFKERDSAEEGSSSRLMAAVKNTGKGNGLTIALLVFLLLATIGYLVYDKVIVSKAVEAKSSHGKQYAPVILKGTIGSNIGNVLRLSFNGNQVEGNEHYDSQQQDAVISIRGSIDENELMTLREFDNGIECGRFEGHFIGYSYSGTFTNAKGKQHPFAARYVTETELEKLLKEQEKNLLAEAYKKKVRTIFNSEYFLYDITGDGVPELWVKHGTCEADYMLNVFTYAHGIKQIYEESASHSYYCAGKDYILQVWGHQGSAVWAKLTYNGHHIVSHDVFKEDLDESGREYYTEPREKYIEPYDEDNLLPIERLKKE